MSNLSLREAQSSVEAAGSEAKLSRLRDAVTACDDSPHLQEPIKDPARFPWDEVPQVAYNYLTVDALTQPMQVREDWSPYGGPA